MHRARRQSVTTRWTKRCNGCALAPSRLPLIQAATVATTLHLFAPFASQRTLAKGATMVVPCACTEHADKASRRAGKGAYGALSRPRGCHRSRRPQWRRRCIFLHLLRASAHSQKVPLWAGRGGELAVAGSTPTMTAIVQWRRRRLGFWRGLRVSSATRGPRGVGTQKMVVSRAGVLVCCRVSAGLGDRTPDTAKVRASQVKSTD